MTIIIIMWYFIYLDLLSTNENVHREALYKVCTEWPVHFIQPWLTVTGCTIFITIQDDMNKVWINTATCLFADNSIASALLLLSCLPKWKSYTYQCAILSCLWGRTSVLLTGHSMKIWEYQHLCKNPFLGTLAHCLVWSWIFINVILYSIILYLIC